jgi:hypothetical protein
VFAPGGKQRGEISPGTQSSPRVQTSYLGANSRCWKPATEPNLKVDIFRVWLPPVASVPFGRASRAWRDCREPRPDCPCSRRRPWRTRRPTRGFLQRKFFSGVVPNKKNTFCPVDSKFKKRRLILRCFFGGGGLACSPATLFTLLHM